MGGKNSTCGRGGTGNTKAVVVLGAQYGDEGKGKLVDLLACDADAVCRFQGGSNAGHTVVINDITYDFHLLPSGVTNAKATSVMGNGMVIHVPTLLEEIQKNVGKGLTGLENRLLISDRAHLVFDMHQLVDRLQEEDKGANSLGTTKKGIGPTYASKANRIGIRVGDLSGNFELFSRKFRDLHASYRKMYSDAPDLDFDVDAELSRYRDLAERIRPMITDTSEYLLNQYMSNKKVLVEGANATMLDIDFGTYPYVTSSNSSIGGVCTGLGIPPSRIGKIYGVVKAYQTRVGDGSFPTELKDEIGALLQKTGHEIGVTTGRIRRCGWLDLVVVRYTHKINDYSALVITKLDVLDGLRELKIGVRYNLDGKELSGYPSNEDILKRVQVEYKTFPGWTATTKDARKWSDLPDNAKQYVKFIQEELNIKVKWIGVGPERDAMILV